MNQSKSIVSALAGWKKQSAAVLLAVITTPRLFAQASPPPLTAREHPFLLFKAEQIPVIRERAGTADGEYYTRQIRHRFNQYYNIWKNADKETSAKNFPAETPMYGAVLHVITGEPEDLARALECLRAWLNNPTPDAINASWGVSPEYAIAYDILHPHLTDAERQKMNDIVVASNKGLPEIVRTAWWFNGLNANNRNTGNWTPIGVVLGDLANMAIEGQPGYNADMHGIFVELMRKFLDNGIAVDGAMYEGVQYPMNYGTHWTPVYVMALRNQGVDLINTTNLPRAARWFAQELLPWGGEAQAINKSNGGYQSATFATFLGSEFPDQFGAWVLMNGRGWMGATDNGADAGIIALFNGIPKRPEGGLEELNQKRLAPTPFWEWEQTIDPAFTPFKLPLGVWFPTIAKTISRSGWNLRDAHFTHTANNAYNPGHSHADHGAITFADRGLNFLIDAGYSYYNAEDHNLVLVDGKAQSPIEGGVESFMRSGDFTAYADLTDLDQTMAYNRALAASGTVFYWETYQPMERAERQTLFVRGATGPFIVVADTLRKDEQTHTYEWLAHTGTNNRITTQERGFRIDGRWGGDFVYSIGPGQTGAFVAPNIEAGTYRGWLLVRHLPFPRKGGETVVTINGQRNARRALFGLGEYGGGWYWEPLGLELAPLAEGEKQRRLIPEMTLPAGELRVELTGLTGGAAALAVFTTNPQWQPGFEIPKHGGDFVVMDAAAFQEVATKAPWGRARIPNSHLDALFLGQAPLLVTHEISKSTTLPRVKATRQTTGAQFITVLAASDDDTSRVITAVNGNPQAAVIQGTGAGLDFIASATGGGKTGGDLVTDAVAATAALRDAKDPMPSAFAVVTGKETAFRDRPLLSASQPVHVINDGAQIIVRGPGGAQLTIARLDAQRLFINGQEAALPVNEELVKVAIPTLPAEWTVKTSADGRLIELTGAGPLPVHVPGEKAIDVKVNGVSRFFPRDAHGEVWPALEYGAGMIPADRNGLTPEQMRKMLAAPDQAPVTVLAASRLAALAVSGEHRFALHSQSAGPHVLIVRYSASPGEKVKIELAGQEYTVTGGQAAVNEVSNLRLGPLVLPAGPVPVKFTGGNYALVGLALDPVMRVVGAKNWMCIGPFGPKNPHATPDPANCGPGVKAGLTTEFPPDQTLDFAATYPGTEGATVRWQHTDATLNQKNFDDCVDFEVINASHLRGVYYGVTHIISPDERTVLMRLSADYWATARLNGEPVITNRSPNEEREDGATIRGPFKVDASVKLRKGDNLFVAKVVSGGGGSAFYLEINDTADLKFSPQAD